MLLLAAAQYQQEADPLLPTSSQNTKLGTVYSRVKNDANDNEVSVGGWVVEWLGGWVVGRRGPAHVLRPLAKPIKTPAPTHSQRIWLQVAVAVMSSSISEGACQHHYHYRPWLSLFLPWGGEEVSLITLIIMIIIII